MGGGRGRVKRVMANRQSAQRSRMRKLQFISDLEAEVTRLQGDLEELSPTIAALRTKHAGARCGAGLGLFGPCVLPCSVGVQQCIAGALVLITCSLRQDGCDQALKAVCTWLGGFCMCCPALLWSRLC